MGLAQFDLLGFNPVLALPSRAIRLNSLSLQAALVTMNGRSVLPLQ